MSQPEIVSEDRERYDEASGQGRRLLDRLLRTPIGSLLPARRPMTTPLATPAREAIEAMAEAKIGSMLVVDARGRLAGIFTERDVVARLVRPGDDAGDVTVRALMTAVPTALRADDPVCHAFALVGGQQRHRHVPVVDAERRPIGLLSARDLVALVVDALPSALANLPPVPTQVTAERFGP